MNLALALTIVLLAVAALFALVLDPIGKSRFTIILLYVSLILSWIVICVGVPIGVSFAVYLIIRAIATHS